MYAGDWALRLSQLVRQSAPAGAWHVPATVWGLGITSLLTDVSSEMVVSILPAYLMFMSGGGPVALGIAAGLYEGGPVVATWLGGWMADRSGRRKLTAGCGYALSAICRLGWLLVSGRALGPIAALVVADRLGKAIRTAPRDALISLSVPHHQLATAFGVHRALDAVGAALGPVAAWMLLSMHPRRYDIVFFASIVAALLGLVALVLLVRDDRQPPSERMRWRQMRGSASDFFAEATLRRVLVIATLLGGVTIRDAFVYLLLVRGTEASAHWIPLLYSGPRWSFWRSRFRSASWPTALGVHASSSPATPSCSPCMRSRSAPQTPGRGTRSVALPCSASTTRAPMGCWLGSRPGCFPPTGARSGWPGSSRG